MQATTAPEVGQTAPDFRLKGPGGQYVSLAVLAHRDQTPTPSDLPDNERLVAAVQALG